MRRCSTVSSPVIGCIGAAERRLSTCIGLLGDIAGIVALVEACGPYLTRHGAYLYLIYTRCFRDTCAVAMMNGKVVGWCSTLPVTRGSYFIHQLGIARKARGRGVALALFAYLIGKLRARHGDDFRLEYTADHRRV